MSNRARWEACLPSSGQSCSLSRAFPVQILLLEGYFEQHPGWSHAVAGTRTCSNMGYENILWPGLEAANRFGGKCIIKCQVSNHDTFMQKATSTYKDLIVHSHSSEQPRSSLKCKRICHLSEQLLLCLDFIVKKSADMQDLPFDIPREEFLCLHHLWLLVSFNLLLVILSALAEECLCGHSPGSWSRPCRRSGMMQGMIIYGWIAAAEHVFGSLAQGLTKYTWEYCCIDQSYLCKIADLLLRATHGSSARDAGLNKLGLSETNSHGVLPASSTSQARHWLKEPRSCGIYERLVETTRTHITQIRLRGGVTLNLLSYHHISDQKL